MRPEYLDQWINLNEKAEVALVSPPISFPPVASVGLSIFQSALDAAGITSRVIYTMFPMVHYFKAEYVYELHDYMDFQNHAEIFFAHLTDVSPRYGLEKYMDQYSIMFPEEKKKRFRELILFGIEAAEAVVDAAARRIVHMGARVVAVSSVFAQQNGSLAIMKRVKELDPSITTIIGGFNLSGEMGMAVLHHYPSADYVSFGEGDETIVQVCEILLGKRKEPMPYGILKHGDPDPEKPPYRMTKDMNLVPTPTYRDFFEEVEREKAGFYGELQHYYGETFDHVIFLEGSRGCWWGAKRSCAFCGLNGLNHVYREKDPEKLHEEIRMMARTYPGAQIQLSDNILSRNMLKKLLPALAQDEEEYKILAEVKANLKPSEVEALAKAGVTITQPGIESLNDHLLEVMGKGTTALQNIALLKYCISYGVFPVWNMMFAVPEEEQEDYEEMVELIPLITHLTPPTRANHIMFSRFARYTDDPEKFGLELIPKILYRFCFGDREELYQSMGIYYDVVGGAFSEKYKELVPVYGKIDKAVNDWRSLYYSENYPFLKMTEQILGIFIYDSRPCTKEDRTIIIGLQASLYKLAWEPVSFEHLCQELPTIDPEAIRKALNQLIDRKLMICIKGRYLALASL